MIRNLWLLPVSLTAAVLLAGAPHAGAQVFGSGPSDPNLFTNGVFNLPQDTASRSVGALQQLNIGDGGVVESFFIANTGSEVNVNGGSTRNNFSARFGSEVNISAGIVGDNFEANFGSQVNISGGVVGAGFFARAGSEVNISGGNIKAGFWAGNGSEVNISGGNIFDGFSAFYGSRVNIFGVDFTLDGVPIDNLILGEALTLDIRDVTLAGRLDNGTPFRFDLNSDFSGDHDHFSVATLTITLVPEPSSLALFVICGVCPVIGRRCK